MTPTSVELAASQMSMGNFLFADRRCHWRFEGEQGESRSRDEYRRFALLGAAGCIGSQTLWSR
jgi:hypothetical protein